MANFVEAEAAPPRPSGGALVMAVSTDGIKHFEPVVHDGVKAA